MTSSTKRRTPPALSLREVAALRIRTARDAYDLLGVTPGATHADVVTAHRLLSRQFHPDLHPADDAQELSASINVAYSSIRTPEARRTYDARNRIVKCVRCKGRGWIATSPGRSRLCSVCGGSGR